MLKELGIFAIAAAQVAGAFLVVGYFFSKIVIPLFKN